ncbi:MAG: NADH-quinone oxidoreductase subunit A [Deltaproteobacteria bacterium]|nr:NADH-quinone oxidoreductase subunit A [Deltaproteobacteria bacterium]
MFEHYFSLFALIAFAALIILIFLALSIFLGPKRRTPMKEDPFECGTISSGTSGQRFGVKFLLVAVLFVVFDVEVVFLYPWAIQLAEMGWPGFWLAMPFLFILEIGLLYIYRRRVLDWL